MKKWQCDHYCPRFLAASFRLLTEGSIGPQPWGIYFYLILQYILSFHAAVSSANLHGVSSSTKKWRKTEHSTTCVRHTYHMTRSTKSGKLGVKNDEHLRANYTYRNNTTDLSKPRHLYNFNKTSDWRRPYFNLACTTPTLDIRVLTHWYWVTMLLRAAAEVSKAVNNC